MRNVRLDNAETVSEDVKNALNTPGYILDCVRKASTNGRIALDPCSNSRSIVNATHSFDIETDGLDKDWLSFADKEGSVFVNPPYGSGHLIEWARKIREEAANGCEMISLVPCAHTTLWFKVMKANAKAICYISKRIKFDGGAHNSGMFDSVAFYFGPNVEAFRSSFAKLGDVRIL